MKQDELIQIAKSLAMQNYENGFDFYVECFDDSDWIELLNERNITTVNELVQSMNFQAGLRNDAMANAEAFSTEDPDKPENNFKTIIMKSEVA